MGRILTPLGVHRFHLTTIYKACLFLLWFLGYGYSRHQTVAPHIADLSICTFWRSSRVTTWFQWTELASMLLCQVNVQFMAFLCTPGHPLLVVNIRPYLGGSLYGTGTILVIPSQFPPPYLPVKIIYKNGERTQLQLTYWQDLPSQKSECKCK